MQTVLVLLGKHQSSSSVKAYIANREKMCVEALIRTLAQNTSILDQIDRSLEKAPHVLMF